MEGFNSIKTTPTAMVADTSLSTGIKMPLPSGLPKTTIAITTVARIIHQKA
jgi:hypothetical protein